MKEINFLGSMLISHDGMAASIHSENATSVFYKYLYEQNKTGKVVPFEL